MSTTALITISFIYWFYERKKVKHRFSKKTKTHVAKEENSRNDFRIKFYKKNCLMKLVSFDAPQFAKLENKYFHSDIEDISAGGLKFSTKYNIPTDDRVVIQVELSLESYHFNLLGEIIRREPYQQGQRISYGVNFIHMSHSDKSTMIRALNEIMIKKQKMLDISN
ncbi:PilZ domain-containing protein [Gracilibacillus sp. S3-1-1]|uniref:PilZ domain-containing protein n=1 Tax=Gracilibacillus pellucidus TaxID=3095368 RepID=A0ACC6M4M1_9BACI|nr:PilZ domain-containing protein [Gracilibacillus sp. S3-1-1]MDX8045859.1 PilZ domain-containing protein [Gracilibacillus sp. S3-1-1]